MTATPKSCDINDDINYASMSNKKIYGKTSHRISLYEAIKNNIITDFKIIITAISSNDILNDSEYSIGNGEKAENPSEVAQKIALTQTINKYDIKKVITFHRTIESAEEFIDVESKSSLKKMLPKFNTN